ncbi:MAG: tRNA 4-thiouridine(8) synthase ThiI [Lachnospiraceae bacterium]|nr:tRNA 4-thiouridine(8) synthase ThiI [Lachnospiraceae bacterium]
MEYKSFLIKYAEIGLKGKNRSYFEDCLVNQVRENLSHLGDYHVRKEQGRIYVDCPDGYDYDDTVDCLSKIFGIVGFMPVMEIASTEWDDICKMAVEFVEESFEKKDFTFKMFCKRGDKTYPKTSPEIAADLGGVILDHFPGLSVDVLHPEKSITVEVRSHAYIYSDGYKGVGGMPVGCNGKAMLLLSGGIDSPVAGYMIAKRGVSIDATYFHAPPYTSERAKQKVIDLAQQISKYVGPIKLNIVNFTDIQMYIYENCPHEELTILMRRYMMRIAEEIANRSNCLALITGESLGQVASQTMQSLNCTNAVCSIPVYRPLIGFDKSEIVEISQRIGTFETSILPYEDCCTIYVAKHPVTKPILKVIERSEKLLEEKIDEMVMKAIDEREVTKIKQEN